ncbi:GM22766 [Drosophila sechellia]|uniref:GM22766 n=1 Tax=Drosophila sechellia TaxID=7238 RepID=B4I714_DROSE|nr:GM22766 [Drosophila sechellia]
MAGDAENKRGYRTIFRSISQVFYANAKNSSNTNSSSNNKNNIISYNNNTIENNNEGIGRLTVTLTSITPPTATWTSTSPTISTCRTASASAGSSTASSSPLASRSARSAENISCSECGNPDPYHGHESAKGQALTPEVPANVDLRPAVPAVPVPAACADQNQKLRASSMLDLTSNHRHQNALRRAK